MCNYTDLMLQHSICYARIFEWHVLYLYSVNSLKCIHSGYPSIRTRQVGICLVTKCMDAEDNAIVFGLQERVAPRIQTVPAQTVSITETGETSLWSYP